jgi:hypothetical protein
LMQMTHKGKGPEMYENRRLVDHTVETGIIQNIFPIISLREAMGEHTTWTDR